MAVLYMFFGQLTMAQTLLLLLGAACVFGTLIWLCTKMKKRSADISGGLSLALLAFGALLLASSLVNCAKQLGDGERMAKTFAECALGMCSALMGVCNFLWRGKLRRLESAETEKD